MGPPWWKIDAEVEAYNAVIDPSSVTLKIPEDLWLRHRRVGLALGLH